jgi:hypothetical protein
MLRSCPCPSGTTLDVENGRKGCVGRLRGEQVVGSVSGRSARPDLTVCLEGLKHRLPLSLVLPQVPEQLLLVRILLADPFQALLHAPFRLGG